jgi:N-formylglutamate amidohydrolase
MIEVRRDLYMDEATGERHAGFARMQAVLTDFRAELLRLAVT